MKTGKLEGDKVGKNHKSFVGFGKEFGFYSDEETWSSYWRGRPEGQESGGSIRSRGNSMAWEHHQAASALEV